MLLTPRTVAGKKSEIVSWALALARRYVALARGVRPCGIISPGLGRTPLLGAATAVTPALSPAFLLAVARPPVLPAGPPSPPATSRRAARGATVPRLRAGGSKGFLAPLEQTTSLSRLMSPLTRPRFVASLVRAQGSCELPTAKPRTRRLSLRSEAPCLSTFTPHPSYDDWAWIPSHVARYRSTANHR